MEAMSNSLAIVASKNTGVSELLEEDIRQYIKWLDHMVKEELLISHSDKAEGKLRIGEIIKSKAKSYFW